MRGNWSNLSCAVRRKLCLQLAMDRIPRPRAAMGLVESSAGAGDGDCFADMVQPASKPGQ